MGNIVTAYLTREIFKTSAATLLVLLVIMLSNTLGRILAEIADGDIPQAALWPVMLSQSVGIVSLLLPIAVFLGIVFAFGRMYKDHEIVVMFACGIGYRDFYKPVLLLLLPVLAFSLYTSLWLNAAAQRYAENIVEREEDRHEFQQIKAGQFNQSDSGNQVFYMETLSEDRRELRDIIIGQSGDDLMVLETAEAGRQKIDEASGDLFLVVGPGERHEGRAGSHDFRIIEFEQHGILIENKKDEEAAEWRVETLTLAELWRSDQLGERVELHWRIAIPAALAVLALLAVPLAYIAPRQGRFGKVGYALLVYIVYMNLMAVTRAQLEAGAFPMPVNFWWIHLLFIGLTLGLLYRRNHGNLFRPAS